MLIKFSDAYIDPSEVRSIRSITGYSEPVVAVRWKHHGDELHYKGIDLEEAVRRINEALRNPLFYEEDES